VADDGARGDGVTGAVKDRGGLLVVDKPPGMTSHDVVASVRRRLRGAKVGHTGTLDPFATGVLPLVVGSATRLAAYLTSSDKEYEALVRLGRATDTHDGTGRTVFEAPPEAVLPGPEAIGEVLSGFLGTWLQVPPAFSAKRAAGARAYELARRGAAVALAPVEVTVRELELRSVDGTLVSVRLVSSAGFYVRAFADEVGRRLGTGACLEQLRRTRSGAFGLGQAVTLERALTDDIRALLVPLEALLTEWPSVVLTAEGVDEVRHGRSVGPARWTGPGPPADCPTRVRLLGPDARVVALAEIGPGRSLRPAVVLV
jgi:tRNA pseudouridine55 synthase